MKNLEQIRAKHALAFWEPAYEKLRQATEAEMRGDKRTAERLRGDIDETYGGAAGGDVVRGLSSLIINNGLLASIAFAKEKGKGYDTFMKEIGRFLGSTGDDGRKVLPQQVASLDQFISVLTSNDSELLQQATAEALAYLGYLKRFRSK